MATRGDLEVVAQEVEVVQMPHELPFIYHWVSRDVLGSPSILSQDYLDELKLSGVIFGAESLRGNIGSKPSIPFFDFQQHLLKQASIAPSQLHPNTWSAIRCLKLVTKFLELPQEPEMKNRETIHKIYSGSTQSLCLRPLFSITIEISTKPPSFKVLDKPLQQEHLNLTPHGLNADQKDIADILVFLFSKHNLDPKSILGRPEDARRAIVRMVGNDVTFPCLRRLFRPSLAGSVLTFSGPVSVGGALVVQARYVG
ncbi:hypothetical protein PIB30_044693 [Stylosanthes scabra]|uniref:Uncharacterized protein n=1 Tax=Stylosanthes scabra TaxID=79078 RepID=A0ABU6SFS9_9FABA|nr:hypothetical protein [Stylosanthes scabra]